MDFFENERITRLYCLFLIVIRNVFSLHLQNILTLLTMSIGAMTLAATLFVGEGARLRLWDDLDRLMGNRVIVRPDAGPDNALLKKRPHALFTTADFNYVKDHLKSANYVVPRYFGRSVVEYKDKHFNLPVDGIVTEQEQEQFFQPIHGRSFSPSARKALIWECLITEETAKFLKINLEEGSTIKVGKQSFHIVGIVPDPPETDRRFQSRIVVPFFAAQLLWGRPGSYDNLVVSWDNSQEMEMNLEALRSALDKCRAPNAYYLSSSQFKLKKRKSIVMNFMVLGATQALFSIIVASMGVINVMLSNVIKRMHEFAIRVAMGAQHRDLVFLVLTESFMLGLIGSLVGIILAVTISPWICHLIGSKISEATQLSPYITTKGIIIPIVVCSLSGLLAGIIPAIWVKRLDILSHLRAE
ncbi:MAG: ABC transporter permease [Candidatus Omnitrophica bacterium]|nr:ABC transporter permease [Candidatus Omnitrophota bacterium]